MKIFISATILAILKLISANKVYICMEYIDGISLYQYLDGLRQKFMKMNEKDIYHLLIQVFINLILLLIFIDIY